MADPRLHPLQPEKISGLLGRWPAQRATSAGDSLPDAKDAAPGAEGSAPGIFIFKRIEPRTRFALIALAAMALLLCLAYLDHGLTNPRGVRITIGIIIHPEPSPGLVSLPLLQDPVGLIAIVMTLLTPVLFAEQVSAIQVFNEANEGNVAYRASSLSSKEINQQVQWTNKRFEIIGHDGFSAGVFLVSAGLSFLIDFLIDVWGLFPSWNRTHLADEVWRRRVYAGWWANPHSHFILAIALWLLGCYFFYFVIKQVLMGAYFAIYVHRISKYKFGVSPDMSANTDGFWGLLTMRRFMQSTYSSALGHTIMVLGILVIWLPFNAFTVFVLALVMSINALVVIYPSVVGHSGAYSEKKQYAQHILAGVQEPAEAGPALSEIWDRPILPFRARSALTAVTVYLLFPLVLAVVSSLLGR